MANLDIAGLQFYSAFLNLIARLGEPIPERLCRRRRQGQTIVTHEASAEPVWLSIAIARFI